MTHMVWQKLPGAKIDSPEIEDPFRLMRGGFFMPVLKQI